MPKSLFLNDAGTHLDDLGTAFFKRELELIKAQSYDVKYAELKARQVFPVSNDGGLGITNITYNSFDKTGKAKIITGGSQDLPRAEVGGRQITHPVEMLGMAYGWNVREIAFAAQTNRPIDRMRAQAADRSIEELINDIAFYGDNEHNLPGFLSNVDIPSAVAPNGAGGFPQWSTKTPAEIYFDLVNICASIFEDSKMVEQPNTILLPPAQWNLISSVRMADGTDTTVMQYFVNNNNWGIGKEDFMPLNELTTAGVGDTARMVAYNRDVEKLELAIPSELQYLPPEQRALEQLVAGFATISGVIVRYPLSASFYDDI